jgi:hypothetical protein
MDEALLALKIADLGLPLPTAASVLSTAPAVPAAASAAKAKP